MDSIDTTDKDYSEKNYRSAIYPGSFDPITNGHIDIINRGLKIFNKIIVAVACNTRKQPLFTIEEKIDMIKNSFKGNPNIEVDYFYGLLIDYARKKGVKIIIRGLRAVSDFEYEFQMALTNRKLYPDIETFFLMSSEQYTYLSSGVVREISNFGGSVEGMVPNIVNKKLIEKYKLLKEESKNCHG